MAPGSGHAPGGSPYRAGLLARIVALCEADPEREACGFVVLRGEETYVVPASNVADRHHVADPVGFPRGSRESYLVDPHAQLRLHRELEASGGRILAVWHSHVEAGAYLSDQDRADAVVDGVQQVPGAEYLVFGVRGGRVTDARRYRLEGGAFVEAALELPPALRSR